jgi:hypothetical protein
MRLSEALSTIGFAQGIRLTHELRERLAGFRQAVY